MTKKAKYTRKALLNYLREFAKEKGRNPTARDFSKNSNLPNYSTIQREFGTWDNGLIEAGLNPDCAHTKEEIINSLKRFANKYGHPPMQKDFNKNPDYPSQSSVQRVFGSWSSALKAADLTPNRNVYTKEEIIFLIRRFAEEYGREPVASDCVGNKDLKYNIIHSAIKEFGSWDEAKKAAGFDTVNSTTKSRQCEIQIFNSFKGSGAVNLAGKNRHSPFDGLCPKGKLYDVKSSKLYCKGTVKLWKFNSTEVQLKDSDYFFLVAFDEDYDKLLFVWRVDKEFMRNRKYINVSVNSAYEHNIETMKKYDITKDLK